MAHGRSSRGQVLQFPALTRRSSWRKDDSEVLVAKLLTSWGLVENIGKRYIYIHIYNIIFI